MNPIDILGDLLGHKTRKSGRGSDSLKDIFGRRSRPSQASKPLRPDEIKDAARELEELLNVANDRSRTTTEISGQSSAPSRDSMVVPAAPRNDDQDNQRAAILIRAMVNAAKADGQLDRKEQQEILSRMENRDELSIRYLQQEFDRPLDVAAFVNDVPLGMEQQVYMMSLIAIDLDTGKEAQYLMELANGLRLPQDVRERIHADLGAPSVY